MEYSFLLQFEAIIFVVSLGYILYYLGDNFLRKNHISFRGFKTKKASRKTLLNGKKTVKTTATKNKKSKLLVGEKNKITEKQKLRIIEIIKRVQMNSSKGYFDTSKNLIVEGLAIDNGNKDLNLELASIYEKEKNYKNAQYIYEDLIDKLEDNYEVIKKLAFSLALQGKYKKSVKQYTHAFEKKSSDMEVLDALANLLYELGDFKESLKYIKMYLIQKPRNIEKLIMKGVCFEKLDKNKQALEVYNKILEIQPYNSEIIAKVKHLEK